MNTVKNCVTTHLIDTDNDLSTSVCVPNKTEDLKLHVFNMKIGINESRTIANHMS